MKTIAMSLFVLVVIAGWNLAQFKALQNPSAITVEKAAIEHAANTPDASGQCADSAIELPWPLMERIQIAGNGPGRPDYPNELRALNGKYVHVPGVFSPLEALKSGEVFLGGVIQPPSKLACCGLTCDPRTQLLIFVDCSVNPWTGGKTRSLVSVIGKLELAADNSSWGNASLSGVRIVPLQK